MAQSIGLNRKRQVPAEETPGFGAIAERFRRAGDLERAVALCLEGLAKFPNIVSARVTLGWALLDLGRYDEARQALETALKRAPDNLAAIRGLAELHDRAEHTMTVPLDGHDQLDVDPAATDSPAQAEPLSLDSVLAGAKPKGAKGKKGKDPSAADVVMTPAAESGAIPDLIQSTSHRGHQSSQPAPEVKAPAAVSADEASNVDLNALLNEIAQVDATVAPPEDAGVDLNADSDDADIEKALQMAQAAAEQAAADAAATRKAAEQQSAAEAAARRAAEEQSAAEAAARKVAEEKTAVERAARQAAEERAAVAEAAARKAAEDKAASEAAARKAAEQKAAEEVAAKKAAEKAAAEAAARQAAEQKAAAEAAAKKAAEERAAAQAAAREAAEKAEAEVRARKAAEEKAAAEAAARKAAEDKAAAEKAARRAAEKAAAEAARKAAEDRAAAEAAAKKAAEERAAAEAAARRAADEKVEKAEAAAKLAAKTAAAETEARKAAEERAAAEAAARAAAEDAAANARPPLRLTNPTSQDSPDPHIQIRADAHNGVETTHEAAGHNGAAIGLAAHGAAEVSQPGSILNLSSPVPVSRTGPPRRALPELESLLRRVESRRAQLMTESVA